MRRIPRNATIALVLGLLGLATLAGCKSAWVSSGILYTEQGNYDKAVVMYETGLWYNPEDADAHYYLGYILSNEITEDHIAEAEWDSAIIKMERAHHHFLEAARIKPDQYGYNPDAEEEIDERPVDNAISAAYAQAFNSGVRANQQGDSEEAAHYFQLAYAADPRGEAGFNAQMNYVQLRLNEAVEGDSVDQARVEEMLALMDDITPPDPAAKADLVKTRAQALKWVDRDAEATQLYEELLAEFPRDVSLLQRVANARLDEGNVAGAAELYARIVNIVEEEVDFTAEDRYASTISAMRIMQDAERFEDALEMGRKAESYAASIDERIAVQRRRARIFYEIERYQEALDAAEAVIAEFPDDRSAWQIKTFSLSRLERTDEAIAARERLRELGG